MLVIHIGSPKTGTTAIQGVLKVNAPALADQGVYYVQAGRTNIAHNYLVKPLLQGRASDLMAAIATEVRAHPDKTHVLSSEFFFQPAVAPLLAEGLAGLDQPVRVIGYLRRPDHYAEAMYKQKVKNGRIAPDPAQFLDAWMPKLDYGTILDAYRDAFGADAMSICPFERRHLVAGDVVTDFLDRAGVGQTDGLLRPETPSNKTLSRAVSEQLGRVNRSTDFNSRVMIREIAAAADPLTLRSGDVYDKATRLNIREATRKDVAKVSSLYFPNRGDGFDYADLEPDAPDTYPDLAEANALERAASDVVIAAIGRQAKARAAQHQVEEP